LKLRFHTLGLYLTPLQGCTHIAQFSPDNTEIVNRE